MNIKTWIKVNRINLIFLSEWGLYLIFELVMGSFTTWKIFVMNLLPFIFLYLVAISLKWLSTKIEKPMLSKQIFFWMISLVAFDHLVKFVIKTFVETGEKIPLILDWLYISNVLNEHGSFLTSRFDLNVNMGLLILINGVGFYFMMQGFRYYKLKQRQSFWIDLTMILLLAGALSSLIDKTFFGGSLDFIGLSGLFVADLKDFYLTIGLGTLVVEVFENPDLSGLNGSIKDDIRLIKDFMIFSFGLRKKGTGN